MRNGEFTRDDLVVDPDIEVDYEEDNSICAYLETWFDVDEKFGLNINDREDTWLNMYATYNPIENTLQIDCLIESENSEKSFRSRVDQEYDRREDSRCLRYDSRRILGVLWR